MQVVVYTGAVMMLFLFVLMLVGVDSADSLVETLRGQRIAAVVAAIGFGGLLVFGLGDAVVSNAGLTKANAEGNVQGLADLIFSRYVFAFEVTSALLITAAMGAMVLAHRERHEPKVTQRDLSVQRFRGGLNPAPLPGPGVYARHNAVDTPALLPDGTPAEVSVSRVLVARGDIRRVARHRAGRRGRRTRRGRTTHEPDELRLPLGRSCSPSAPRASCCAATRSSSSCASS